ncbi:FCD domain-containing protein [Sphingobium sp. HBC34]|uniref:FCD domain-containing protein n=1 Tax=Sphingobium cyanobacteriorum TaxID=3063954 RepID=A0ABT8ZPE1_9SPHN|nr:FCD domain-containing protein [Sphingobium sp. HBC34]MDO7835630.1 FCD domain-containing protein [Sphingobium sp. HBC34]
MSSPAADATPRVSERIEAEIEALIARRKLLPGARLPSERALAQALGVSRASLREAVGRMAAHGRLMVRRTGIVLAQPAAQWTEQAISAPLAPLVAVNPGYGHDIFEVRESLDATAAYHAALRADGADKDRIRRRFDTMEALHVKGDGAEQAHADAAFHLAIAHASHNAVLAHVMSSLFNLLHASISRSREKLYAVPRTFEALSAQHRLMMDRILAGDADGARDAANVHLRFVRTSVQQVEEDIARQARAAIARNAEPMA